MTVSEALEELKEVINLIVNAENELRQITNIDIEPPPPWDESYISFQQVQHEDLYELIKLWG
ncbi:hypothetical protein DRN58_04095 [Thermococci archaeon]|nr:MAG: hypothetical protein DRN58_04095 [Thermococci archaeon]